MKPASYAALCAALVMIPLAGCASIENPVPAPIVTDVEVAFQAVCAWEPEAAVAYNLVSGFLPASISAPAGAAVRLISATCANPPTDLASTIAALVSAEATIQAALTQGNARALLTAHQHAKVVRAIQHGHRMEMRARAALHG